MNTTNTLDGVGEEVVGGVAWVIAVAYNQVQSNAIYSSTLAGIVLLAFAWLKSRLEFFLAGVLLVQVELDSEATKRLQAYASFQLQESALITDVASMDGGHSEIQDFATFTLARIEGAAPQTVQFKMGNSSSGLFWVPSLVRVVPPSQMPTLRGPPLGCGPDWISAVTMVVVVSIVTCAAVVQGQLPWLGLVLRMLWLVGLPIAAVRWTDRGCVPIKVDSNDAAGIQGLADTLRRFYEAHAVPGAAAELQRATAQEELDRANLDPAHFRKRARRAALDSTGLRLPGELRAGFNVDLDGRPFGWGYGTWMSWLLPAVWIVPAPDQYPGWVDRLPPALAKQAKSIYDRLFNPSDPNQRNQQRMTTNVTTLCTFAWHGRFLIETILDQADELHRIKNNDSSTLNYNAGPTDGDDGGGRGMGRHRVRQRTLGRGGGRGGRGRSLTVNRPGWRSVVGPPRRAETIVMGPDAQTLWRDVEDFLSPGARESFQARTMPYQRCYLLYGPPGNGKSSLLQALSIKFKLELFFPKVTKTMTKDELSKLLLPNHSNCMICLEDAESAFQSAAELEKQQNRMKYVSFGKGGFGNQVGASDGGNVGGGNGGGETPDSADGAPPSSFGGPGPEVVTPDVFIKLLRGEGATSPNKRLIFFSTNHVNKMPLEILEFVASQGSRACFPNCDKAMMKSTFNMFFPKVLDAVEPSRQRSANSHSRTAEELDKYRREFIANVTQAGKGGGWFTGFAESNVSGACLSEYFQRHRDNPMQAANSVSGSATDSLQTIVERSGATALSDGNDPSGKIDPDLAKALAASSLTSTLGWSMTGESTTADGAASLSNAAWAGQRLPVVCWALGVVMAVVGVEYGARNHATVMFMLVFAPTIVTAISTTLWKSALSVVVLAALCTLDCDGDGAVWAIDPMGDTMPCVEWGVQTVQKHQLIAEYILPRVDKMVIEAWATVPMALCVGAFIACWLAVDWVATRITAFAWLRFQIDVDDDLTQTITTTIQRASRESAPRAVLGTATEGLDWEGRPKLFSLNHEPNSIGDSKFRPVAAKDTGNLWSTVKIAGLPSSCAVSVWIRRCEPRCYACGGVCKDVCKVTYEHIGQVSEEDGGLELQLWRWGPSWLPPLPLAWTGVTVNGYDCRELLVQFLEAERKRLLDDRLKEPPKIHLKEHPSNPAPGFSDPFVPIGGLSSYVWPEDPSPLWGLFDDAVHFQTVENKKWYMKRGIPFRRGYFLHGPPKSGKTHFVKLVARHLGAQLHVVDLASPTLTDEMLISVFQGNEGQSASPFSVVLFKNVEKVVQYRSMKNDFLTYTTLLNVLDGPFASTNGVISIICCSDFEHFSQDETSIDALLRPGRVAKQVGLSATPQLRDMFTMMLGTNSSTVDGPFRIPVRGQHSTDQQDWPRPSQYKLEKSDEVRRAADQFSGQWTKCFNPVQSNPRTPSLSYTMADVKNYLGQYFTGQQTWAGEMSEQHREKLERATDPENMNEAKHRLMELRRSAKLSAAKAEPDTLSKLQVQLAEKDESEAFFQCRVDQACELLNELESLAPPTDSILPAFVRPYKPRNKMETKAIEELRGCVETAKAGGDIKKFIDDLFKSKSTTSTASAKGSGTAAFGSFPIAPNGLTKPGGARLT